MIKLRIMKACIIEIEARKALLFVLMIVAISPVLANCSTGHKARDEQEGGDAGYKRMLVVYNENSADTDGNGIPDSKDIALYYQQQRNIADECLLGVKSKTALHYQAEEWPRLINELVNPICDKLATLPDTQIYYILLCGNIPAGYHVPDSIPGMNVRRSVDNALAGLHHMGTAQAPVIPHFWYINPFFEGTPTRYGDKRGFDHHFRLMGKRIYLVSRLTNSTLHNTLNLVDMALYGDKYITLEEGYYNGVAYIDNQKGTYDEDQQARYPYIFTLEAGEKELDPSIYMITKMCEERGMPYRNEPGEEEIGSPDAEFADGSPADSGRRAMLYGGWYNVSNYNDVYEWLPGAAALDVNSNSGDSLGHGHSTFLPSAFRRGLTAGVGVVCEPFVPGHPRPDVFHYYLLYEGYNFIESAWHAEPCIMWQGISMGDPLYQPYRKGKEPVKDDHLKEAKAEIVEKEGDYYLKLDFQPTAESPELARIKVFRGSELLYRGDQFFARYHARLGDKEKLSGEIIRVQMTDPSGNSAEIELTIP